jgi:tetratricopeptide (TPR) repeat protein
MSVRRFHLFFLCWLALVLQVSLSLPAAAQTKVQAAVQLEQQGSYLKAEEAWREVTTDDPQNATAWAHLGLVQAMQGKYAEAAPAYRKALQLDPRQTGVQLNLGLSLFKQQHFQEAIPAFTAAAEEAPNDVKPRLLLGMSYYAAAEYAEAIPHLRSALSASPENLQLRMTLAQSCLWAAQYQCTLEQYRQIVLQDPESAQAYVLAGEAYDGLGETAQAITQFRAAEKSSSHEPDVHFGLGYLFWKQRQYDEAERELKLELENNPNHAQALAYMGDIAIKREDKAAAMDYLQRAIAQPGKEIRLAYVDLGILNAANKRNEEAEKDFQHAIAMEPNEVDAHWRLARVYQAMGKKTEADAELSTVNQLHKTKDEELVRRMTGSPLTQAPQAQPQ